MGNQSDIKVVVIGGSTGGIAAVEQLLRALPKNYPIPIIIVLHRGKNIRSSLVDVLQQNTKLTVREANEKETLRPGIAYVAPANYHLLVEGNYELAMDYSEPVNYSRPSIDLTMFSVASVFAGKALGILLSGANRDGGSGLLRMREAGSRCLIQDPKEAPMKSMPKAALKISAGEALSLSEIIQVTRGLAS